MKCERKARDTQFAGLEIHRPPDSRQLLLRKQWHPRSRNAVVIPRCGGCVSQPIDASTPSWRSAWLTTSIVIREKAQSDIHFLLATSNSRQYERSYALQARSSNSVAHSIKVPLLGHIETTAATPSHSPRGGSGKCYERLHLHCLHSCL